MNKGWNEVPISEVTFIQEGPGIRKYEYEEGGYPMINVRCVQDGFIDMSSARAANTELATGKWAHFQIDAGDILFTISGTIGRCAVVQPSDLPLLMNTSVVRFRPTDPRLDSQFLYHFLRSELFQAPLHQLASGTAIRNVGPTHIKTLSIPLPPLEEQQRIVAILDEAFEGLDRAKANAEANLASAKELVEAGIGTAFNPKTAAHHGWEVCELRKLAELSYGYTTKAHPKASGPKFLRITDIQDGAVDWSQVPFCKTPPDDYERYRIKSGDIVFARTGATTGKSYLLTEDVEAVAASYLIRLRLSSASLKPEYLSLFFQSDVYWETIRAGISGSTQGGFNASKLKVLKIPVPSIPEQDAVVSHLLEIQDQAVELNSSYQAKVEHIDQLRQSLLAKAFAGELT